MDTRITVLVPEELHRQAKAAAALQGTTLSEIVRDALEAYVEEVDDIRFVDRVEAAIAAGERTYSHEEVWGDLDESSEPSNGLSA